MRKITIKILKKQIKDLIDKIDIRTKLLKEDEDVLLALKETVAYLESKNDVKA